MDQLIKFVNKKRNQLLVVILATFLAYLNIFQNELILDDQSFITNWEQIRSLENIPTLLRGEMPQIHQGVYRPVRSVLYVLYYQIWSTNPFGYHLHSILIHLISTILVYLIVEQLVLRLHLGGGPLRQRLASTLARSETRKLKYVPFIGGLLFGLHPIHTESITYISASMEMTGVVFFLISFYFYLKYLKLLNYVLSLVFALLALFTYEMTLILPLMIILYDVCFQKDTLKNLGAKIKLWLPYFLGVGTFLFIRMGILKISATRGDYLGFSFYHTMLMMSKVVVKYIWILISPINVSYLHDLAPGFETFMTLHSNISSILSQSIFDLDILGSIIILILIVIIIIKSYKKYPLVSFSISWFFISLIPVSYIFPQGIAMADKYLYIGSMGFVLLVAVFLNWLMAKKKIISWVIVGILGIVLFYGGWTFYLNSTWRNPLSFWSHLETRHPQSALVAYTLGVLYGDQQNWEQAENYYQKTISLDPRFWEAQFNLGNIYLKEGRLDQSLQQYNKVLLINPDFAPAKANLEQILKYTQNQND